MPKRAQPEKFLVALLPPATLDNVVMRLATLKEALAYCRGYNNEVDSSKSCAIIAPDNLPEPPLVGTALRKPR